MALDEDPVYLDYVHTNPLPDQQLVEAFASQSRDLEKLSISFMIDAHQFFDAYRQSYTWPRLRSLTLTSSLLTPDTPEEKILTLLHNASSAALKMPQLETVALWTGKKGEAAAVIYHRKPASRRATLTWRGTWDFELGHGVADSWQKVASDACHLLVESEGVPADEVSSHGDAVHYLGLPGGVVHPVSLWQIR